MNRYDEIMAFGLVLRAALSVLCLSGLAYCCRRLYITASGSIASADHATRAFHGPGKRRS